MSIMIEPGLDANGYCLQLKQAIKDIGAAKAFGLGKIVVAYSGPSQALRGLITTSFTSNWDKSKRQAARLDARRIDDTEVGKFLASSDFEVYFTDFYGHDKVAKEKAELQVWGCASTEFMKARFQELATAVCAADPERVFRKYEIASVLKNRRVRLINNHPVQLFKDFQRIHDDEAYRLFCLTELFQARRHAHKVNTQEAWDDYRERRCFYMTERRYGSRPILCVDTMTKIKQRKQAALSAHNIRLINAQLVGNAARPAQTRRAANAQRKPA